MGFNSSLISIVPQTDLSLPSLRFSGRETALALSAANIPTILIPDSNIFALLPRCSKVLLGPHLILADGALLSISGSLPLCLAANRMRVPVVVVGGMFKFSPVYLGEGDWGMRDLGSPEMVLKSTEIPSLSGGMEEEEDTEVLNPYYDVVSAELVNLYISNLYVLSLLPFSGTTRADILRILTAVDTLHLYCIVS